MSSKTVLSFGQIVWDKFLDGDALGGAPFNFAYRARSLGLDAYIISRIGQDADGERALQSMIQMEMPARFVQRDGTHPTGAIHVTLDEQKNPTYRIMENAAFDHVELTDELQQFAQRCDCICYGTLAQRSEVSRNTLYHLLESSVSPLKLLDLNLRRNGYTPETVTRSLHFADALKLNEEELQYLAESTPLQSQTLKMLCEEIINRWNLKFCIVTLGSQGSFAMLYDGTNVRSPGFQTTVVDPCGCGDAFTAGFLSRYFAADSLESCCRYGNAFGALVASRPGATCPVTIAEIDRFIEASSSQS